MKLYTLITRVTLELQILCQLTVSLLVTGDGDDKYLIATAEQPLCAYHLDDRIHSSELPIRYAGYSSCFRKEAGSHGCYTLGIFRVHQFEKVEEFCITSPNGNESWEMHGEMFKNSEDFYKAAHDRLKHIKRKNAINAMENGRGMSKRRITQVL